MRIQSINQSINPQHAAVYGICTITQYVYLVPSAVDSGQGGVEMPLLTPSLGQLLLEFDFLPLPATHVHRQLIVALLQEGFVVTTAIVTLKQVSPAAGENGARVKGEG